jgi:hypothetical protein
MPTGQWQKVAGTGFRNAWGHFHPTPECGVERGELDPARGKKHDLGCYSQPNPENDYCFYIDPKQFRNHDHKGECACIHDPNF